jgi:hypothetical protein
LNKRLTINIYQDPSKHVEKFLDEWLKFGTYEHEIDLKYKLTSHENMCFTLSIDQDKITIEGVIPSKTFMIIDTLAKTCEADKIIEGEVIDKNKDTFQHHDPFSNQTFSGQANGSFKIPFSFKVLPKITALSKTKLILLLIIALPLLIVMIPIIIIITIIKIIMFKLNFK